MSNAFLGIDPGAKGALACIEGVLVQVEDFPRHADGSIDHIRLAELVERFDHAKLAMIEDVHSMPGQGVASTFSFGENFGAWKQALVSAGIRLRPISPHTWKRQMGVTADKRTSVTAAERLYPSCGPLFHGPRGGLHADRAEAVLLAHLAMRTLRIEGEKAA